MGVLASAVVRALPGVLIIAIAACVKPAQAAGPADPEPATGEEEPGEEDPDVVLSSDSWFIRLDVGGAYLRATTRYNPVSDDSDRDQLEPMGAAITLQLAVAARLGRDVTLGGLGRLVHAPANYYRGEWHDTPQGLYYAELFIDHRLPAKVLRLGGGVGPGVLYTVDPTQESFAQWGPVGSVWLGLDLPTSSRTALGLTADFTGAAMRDRHSFDGSQHQFDTFMLVLGIAVTIRVSEPSLWPRSLPSLARGGVRPSARAHLIGGGS